jgi:membrane protein YdbS with pleckstrin-like domain
MKESGLVHEACKWCYQGVWGVLTNYFSLPKGPPTLPSMEGEAVEYMRPSVAYLNYRKFFFWFGLSAVDIVLFVLWGVFSYWWPLAGLLTAPLWLFAIVVPDIVAYIAIHLRYDTTWYVLTDRSMRIRRGIWSIYETTITFENIQNVHIAQGPVQRWFGFANLMVMTAGGGGGGQEGQAMMGSHVGLMEGLDNAVALRERILARSQLNVGLGDDHGTDQRAERNPNFSTFRKSGLLQESKQNLELLSEIRKLTAELAKF